MTRFVDVPTMATLIQRVGVGPFIADLADAIEANFLRWELGYDRFFFLRTLNPSNSFALITALVGSWNVSASKDVFMRLKWEDPEHG